MKKTVFFTILLALLGLVIISCSSMKSVKMKDPKVVACENAAEETFKQCVEDAGDDAVKKTACEVAKKETLKKCNE